MILLTGATGTVGSATAAALKAAGAPFRIGARSAAKAQTLGVPAVEFDWERPPDFDPAFAGADRVFLLTPVSDRQPDYARAAVAAAKRAGVRHIVKLSVIGADAEPGFSWHGSTVRRSGRSRGAASPGPCCGPRSSLRTS